jgi:chromate reductase, NAD(P)H dehydrogenase (quinone)
MVTIISATNRPGNRTQIFAEKYFELVKEQGEEAKLFTLEMLPDSFTLKNIYDYHHPDLYKIIEEYIIPADKLIVLIPEYNAGIPGVFKVFIDAVRPDIMAGKKAALAGVSSGRSGNLRGIDQLTSIFHYIHMDVLPFKVPLSRIDEILDDNRQIKDQLTIETMKLQVAKLLQ